MAQFDVVIVGQGYAGLKAAKLASQKGLKVAAVEAMFPGGLIMSINELHPAPEGEAPCGPELTGDMAMENMDNGTHNVMAETSAITQTADGWQIDAGGEQLLTRNLVIATGARLRKLDVPGEAEYEGRGVSACADCDGPIYMGKEAVVVGGGDSAFQEAAALTMYASKVTVVMRGPAPRAQTELVEAASTNSKIEVISDAVVEEIVGDGTSVTGVSIARNGGTAVLVPCSVVFAFVGLDPATEALPADIARDAVGAIITDENLGAGLSGLWAIGAVRSGFGGLLSDAADDAAKVIAAI